ncbi:hypothetical protein Sste5346_005416 [Sporothrix stenoceras]|uniref:Uncharacterized protein n=1 Tax=Sporothrix stenoceras TaxID=5173 RepID=A0ABR3Z3R1_9PEZI
MDFHGSRAGSPTPLQVISPERVNQQQNNQNNTGFASSVASVTDKISQFNSLAMQSKQLERKTADAALKRAMVGREEAESDMRRYREEARQLRKQVDEGKHREQRVGERLEAVMENYGRAKETHAHTQALWEKEIRRARKETFKSQSAIVKLQEELKAARASTKAAEEALVHEKERSKAREQEAFQARYELVGCQEELEQTLQKVKMLEQERDAFRSLAKSEEDVARIASEGRLPLPPPDAEEEKAAEEEDAKEAEDDKEDSDMTDGDSMDESEDNLTLTIPKQRSKQPKKKGSKKAARVSSVTLLDIRSSAASEAEISELTRLWQWEKQRADRSSELVEYLEAECHLRACSCMRKRPRNSIIDSARKRPNLDIGDGADRIILSEKAAITSPTAKIRASLKPSPSKILQSNFPHISHSPERRRDDNEDEEKEEGGDAQGDQAQQQSPKQKKAPRLSTTIFVPEEGVFRTVSQQIAEEMEEAVAAAAVATMAAMPKEPEVEVHEQVQEQEAEIAPEVEVKAEAEAEIEIEEAAPPTPAPAPAETITQDTRHPFHEILDADDNRDADTTLGDVTTDSADYTVETTTEQSMYARTPSVEPPSYAQQRTSLLSLLDAPHRQEAEQPINFYVPTTQGPLPTEPARHDANIDIHMDDAAEQHEAPRTASSLLVASTSMRHVDTEMDEPASAPIRQVELDEPVVEEEREERISDVTEVAYARSHSSQSVRSNHSNHSHSSSRSSQPSRSRQGRPPSTQQQYEDRDATPVAQPQRYETPAMDESLNGHSSVRPHTVAATNVFKHKTTTTKVPLREETTDPSLAQRIMAAQRTPTNKILPTSASAGSAVYSDGEAAATPGTTDGPSFDINNPALTPTMTREECLAQIRERRGRARSAAGGSSSSSSHSSTRTTSASSAKSATTGTTTTAPGGIRRPITPGKERREVSAPVRRVASVRRVRP